MVKPSPVSRPSSFDVTVAGFAGAGADSFATTFVDAAQEGQKLAYAFTGWSPDLLAA